MYERKVIERVEIIVPYAQRTYDFEKLAAEGFSVVQAEEHGDSEFRMVAEREYSPAAQKHEPMRYHCCIHLKSGGVINTETSDAESFIGEITRVMDRFFRRGWFRTGSSILRLSGVPLVGIPVENINCFTVEEKKLS